MQKIFWNIKSVIVYEDFFNSGIIENSEFHNNYALVKNLSYNIQYLEFLDNTLKEEIHATLRMEFIKTYVIIGMSIIESVLYYFLKSNKLHKTNNYREITTLNTNDKKVGQTWLRAETKLFEKIDIPIEVEMNLDSMLKKAESHKILGNDNSIYIELNRLRKLRNKIHLYLIEQKLDTDWNNFQDNELNMIKSSLRKVIFSSVFNQEDQRKKELFDFLT